MPGDGSECGEVTNVVRDGIWVLVRCTEPLLHGGEHYDRIFSCGWYKTTGDEGVMSCL